jgi:hypothetical protein
LESSFRSFSRPVLHAAARVVQEMGKSRAAAYALGAYDEGATLQAYSDNVESLDSDLENPMAEGIWQCQMYGHIDTIFVLIKSRQLFHTSILYWFGYTTIMCFQIKPN